MPIFTSASARYKVHLNMFFALSWQQSYYFASEILVLDYILVSVPSSFCFAFIVRNSFLSGNFQLILKINILTFERLSTFLLG